MDTIFSKIAEHASSIPDKAAVVFKDDTVSYRVLYERIRQVGTILRSLGVTRGDRVLFTALSKPETIAIYQGIQYCGGIAVFMDKNGTPENAAAIYEDADGRIFLTDKPMKEQAWKCNLYSLRELYQKACEDAEAVMAGDKEAQENILPYQQPDPEAVAEMIFTTGTTGRPKGVMLSYRAIEAITKHTIAGVGILNTDRTLVPLPLNHSLALREVRSALYLGGTVVLQNGFTFARELENNIIGKQCSGMVTVPASLELVRSQMQEKFPEVVGKLRYMEVGAGSLSVRQRRDFAHLLPNTHLVNTWGSSETGGAMFFPVCELADDPVKSASLGVPLPTLEIRVTGPDGKAMEENDHDHPGKLALKGAMVMSGYWNREEQTREALQDGWLLTNDLVYTDDEGFVYMLGRVDDIINVGGEKVSPIEVENLACQYDGVRECACIGVEDPEGVLGQVPVLFTVKNSRYQEQEFKTWLNAKMERFKVPKQFFYVTELPRNRMKKLDRRAMRTLWEERKQTAASEGSGGAQAVIDAILSRQSIRKFTDQAVPKDLLETIVKCGYHAPSGHNLQTWRFTVLTEKETIMRLKEAATEAAKANGVYCYGFNNPAALILVSNDVRNPNSCQDAACAAENMLLAAHASGLGGVWLNVLRTLRDAEPVKSVLDGLGIPAGHTVWSTVALGYPAEEPKRLAKKEKVVFFI